MKDGYSVSAQVMENLITTLILWNNSYIARQKERGEKNIADACACGNGIAITPERGAVRDLLRRSLGSDEMALLVLGIAELTEGRSIETAFFQKGSTCCKLPTVVKVVERLVETRVIKVT